MRHNTPQTLGGSINREHDLHVVRFDDDFPPRNNDGDHATLFVDASAGSIQIGHRYGHSRDAPTETAKSKLQAALKVCE
jgi:hypothetical protein